MPKIIDLPKFKDARGELSIIEEIKNIPFNIARVYLAHGIPKNKNDYTNTESEKFIVALSGSFDVNLYDNVKKYKFELDTPSRGLYIPKGTYIKIENCFENSIVLILESDSFHEKDSFRNNK